MGIDCMSKMPTRQIKAVMTLFGEPRTGKTATLRYLYWLLTGKMPPRVNNCIDFREKFDYTEKDSGKTVIIALSTVGDDEEDVELNWMFFRSKWKIDFKHLGLKTILRSSEDSASESGKVVVVTTTHINDAGARVNDVNIANLKKDLSHVHYLQKKKAGLIIGNHIDNLTWLILTATNHPGSKWNDSMARKAIEMAKQLKEQLDLTIKQL